MGFAARTYGLVRLSWEHCDQSGIKGAALADVRRVLKPAKGAVSLCREDFEQTV